MANPFVHVELNTTDLDKAKKFYGQLFDWKLEDMEMGPTGRYTGLDDHHRGPHGRNPRALEVEELGGTVQGRPSAIRVAPRGVR
jgi:predicted enzyme related to lactoylglutathione lyase